jgi:hypothetical protein
MRALRTLGVLLVVGGAVVAAWRWAAGGPGLPFSGQIERPTWSATGPAVLIDAAHWNHGTGNSRLAALSGLLAADGYTVLPGGNGTRAETLVDARVSVVVNPLGVLGLMRQGADRVGLGRLAFFDDDGLMLQEVETTVQWVENGGSLLLAADEAPLARGSLGLAAALGVRMHGRHVVDVGHSEASSPGWLVFSRENGLIGSHPIVDGWADAPAVNRVVIFGGQALEGPPGAAVLLGLGPSATEVDRAGDPPTSGQSVNGLAMALAIERGRGRVVVLGDSHVLTADPEAGGTPTGLDWSGSNNTRFVRYLMRWLSRRDAAAGGR